jgi:hypothetical protein
MGIARDFSSHISDESKSREPSPLKAFAHHLTIPGIISLGGGCHSNFTVGVNC